MRHIQRVLDSIGGVRKNVDGTDSIEWVWDVVERSSNGQEFGIIRHKKASSAPVVVKVAIPPDLPSEYHLKVVGEGDQSICDNGKHIWVISGSL
jgi:hypothetical protein